MSYDPVENKLMEIDNQLRALDLTPEQREKLLDWIKRGNARNDRIIEQVKNVQEQLGVLRVLIKYQAFDLEATRREKAALQEEVERLHQILENHGYYADAENPPMGFELPPADEGGLIDLPEVGDYIHNDECDHPYSSDCPCMFCEAYRDRQRQQSEGAD